MKFYISILAVLLLVSPAFCEETLGPLQEARDYLVLNFSSLLADRARLDQLEVAELGLGSSSFCNFNGDLDSIAQDLERPAYLFFKHSRNEVARLMDKPEDRTGLAQNMFVLSRLDLTAFSHGEGIDLGRVPESFFVSRALESEGVLCEIEKIFRKNGFSRETLEDVVMLTVDEVQSLKRLMRLVSSGSLSDSGINALTGTREAQALGNLARSLRAKSGEYGDFLDLMRNGEVLFIGGLETVGEGPRLFIVRPELGSRVMVKELRDEIRLDLITALKVLQSARLPVILELEIGVQEFGKDVGSVSLDELRFEFVDDRKSAAYRARLAVLETFRSKGRLFLVGEASRDVLRANYLKVTSPSGLMFLDKMAGEFRSEILLKLYPSKEELKEGGLKLRLSLVRPSVASELTVHSKWRFTFNFEGLGSKLNLEKAYRHIDGRSNLLNGGLEEALAKLTPKQRSRILGRTLQARQEAKRELARLQDAAEKLYWHLKLFWSSSSATEILVSRRVAPGSASSDTPQPAGWGQELITSFLKEKGLTPIVGFIPSSGDAWEDWSQVEIWVIPRPRQEFLGTEELNAARTRDLRERPLRSVQ